MQASEDWRETSPMLMIFWTSDASSANLRPPPINRAVTKTVIDVGLFPGFKIVGVSYLAAFGQPVQGVIGVIVDELGAIRQSQSLTVDVAVVLSGVESISLRIENSVGVL